MSKKVIYARAGGQRCQFSLDLQVDRAKAYLASKGIMDVTVVAEETAKYARIGQGLQKILAMCAKGHIDTLVCASPDRLSRDSQSLHYMLTLMKTHRVSLHFVSDTI